MKFGRIARLYLPPTFVLTALTLPRTPHMGAGVQLLAGWTKPPNGVQGEEPAGSGSDPDASADAGGDAGDDAGIDAGTGASHECGGGEGDHLATTSTLGAGCC